MELKADRVAASLKRKVKQVAEIHFWKLNTRSAQTVVAALLVTALLLLGASCGKKEHYKVLVGATLVTENGARPIPNSIVVIAGSKIDNFGPADRVLVPKNADRTELQGRWIVPAPGNRIDTDNEASLLILEHAPAGVVPAKPSDIGARLVLGEWEAPGR